MAVPRQFLGSPSSYQPRWRADPGISPALETTKRSRLRPLVPVRGGCLLWVWSGLLGPAGLSGLLSLIRLVDFSGLLIFQAWPAVSNMAASSASRADLPAQITN